MVLAFFTLALCIAHKISDPLISFPLLGCSSAVGPDFVALNTAWPNPLTFSEEAVTARCRFLGRDWRLEKGCAGGCGSFEKGRKGVVDGWKV